MPKCEALKWWCYRTPYLPNVDDADTACGPHVLLMGWCCRPCAVGLVHLGVKTYLRWRSGCWTRLHPMCGQQVLTNVPVEGWIINHYEHGLLDGPGIDMWLSTHYEEIFKFHMMTWDVGMVIDKEGSLSPKVLADFSMYSYHTPTYCTCTCILLHFLNHVVYFHRCH